MPEPHKPSAAEIDPALEMRRIRNQVRGQSAVSQLYARGDRGSMAARARLPTICRSLGGCARSRNSPFNRPHRSSGA